jgi:hypothetical protein
MVLHCRFYKLFLVEDFDFCPVTFKRKGCYKDKHDGNHPLPELLFTDRDSSSKVFSGTTIASKNWGSYIIKLICRCAETANQKRFSFFGIQHYGKHQSRHCEIMFTAERPG